MVTDKHGLLFALPIISGFLDIFFGSLSGFSFGVVCFYSHTAQFFITWAWVNASEVARGYFTEESRLTFESKNANRIIPYFPQGPCSHPKQPGAKPE